MIEIEAPYRARSIRPLGMWTVDGFRLKVYGIAYGLDRPVDALVGAARRTAEERLGASAAGTRHYGVGFVGVHQGKTGNFVFVDWWADENELHHHVYVSSSDRPDALEYRTPTGLAACAWDLRVICFERDAWVSSVLERHAAPDLDGYLASTLETDA